MFDGNKYEVKTVLGIVANSIIWMRFPILKRLQNKTYRIRNKSEDESSIGHRYHRVLFCYLTDNKLNLQMKFLRELSA